LVDQSSGNGTKGDAFAKVESVQVISRKGVSTLLHPMTVLFPESKVTAILGPSGSGKTTFLNFLTGTITSNLKADGLVSMSGNIGFVPQDDRLHGFFTCRDYMMHYCRLTGMEDTDETRELAMDLLAGLGLETHVDTVVGDVFRKGLSGGQKRRLSVALEALSRPETLFLDGETIINITACLFHVYVVYPCFVTSNVSCQILYHRTNFWTRQRISISAH
jgi:ABC-type multidrug transport system ATPase subunit